MPNDVGKQRILVVEDEFVIADTLRLILRSHGYDVRTAYSAEGALETLAQWTPNLAILDVILPNMNGIDLAMVLKKGIPACHILLISGQPSVDALLEESKSKGHEFQIFAKPVQPLEMLETIASLFSSNGCEHCHS
jgi:DNA-binding NtrC family response regulator